MAKRLTLALASVLIAAPAAAQTTWYRDAQGRDAGRAERGSDGTVRFYDAQGRNAGRAEPGGPGETRLYGPDGRNAGTIERPGADTPWPPLPPSPRGGTPFPPH